MADEPDASRASSDLPEIVRKIRARTPARLLVGRAGASYRTGTQLDLREAHAAARDAVRTELDLQADFGTGFVNQWDLFEVSTQATCKDEYLLRPDLGRRFSHESRKKLLERCSTGNHLQIAVGDGLSVTAVSRQVPPLLPPLCERAKAKGWSVGHTFVIRHCRVGILNEIRSEEHTSELQSRGHLVCRLLLEKKKKTKKTTYGRDNRSNELERLST